MTCPEIPLRDELRCPSEHLALRLDAVDWDAQRIRVPSRKTEHHEGKEDREIPIFPELRPYLEEVWHKAEPGETHFITKYRKPNQNLRSQLTKILRRAGLKPWPKLWQNLRASRQTELAEGFARHVVCQWIGNSQQVARKHYLQVTDEHFAKAVGGARPVFVPCKAPQGVANEKCDAAKPAENRHVSPCVAVPVGLRGFEPPRPERTLEPESSASANSATGPVTLFDSLINAVYRQVKLKGEGRTTRSGKIRL